MRLDKWLWCARFYKTRSLASSAIKEGKIKIDGSKVKPARLVQIGDQMEIRRKPYQYEINVLNLAKSRSSASDAALLFHESQESVKKREILISQLKLASATREHSGSRPDKQQRRKIIRFTRGSG